MNIKQRFKVSLAINLLLVFVLVLAASAQGMNDLSSNAVNQFSTQYAKITSNPLPIHTNSLALGSGHTCALTNMGGVKCWGNNNDGQLGNGTTIGNVHPGYVFGLVHGVKAVSTGASHSCILTESGGVKCWGSNWSGELGDGTNEPRFIPVDVVGLSQGVTSIALGSSHSCASLTDGSVKCWGANNYGQLGDGTNTDRNTPVDVTGLSDVAKPGAGMYHSCAITYTGLLKCWGRNDYGQLGDNSTEDRNIPVDVVGITSPVVQVNGGYAHTCALTQAGGAKCWGGNSVGQLGDGTRTQRLIPVDVFGLTTEVTSISTGSYFSCAVYTGGVKCWGHNYDGILGNGSLGNYPNYPRAVTGLSTGVLSVSSGSEYSCAILVDGTVKCWGLNETGQLGDGTRGIIRTPTIIGASTDASVVSSGYEHSCWLKDGSVICAGLNSQGQLGNGTWNAIQTTPLETVGLSSGVGQISSGFWHTCAIVNGSAKCWGFNWRGQLGDGSNSDSNFPVQVTGLSEGVTSISAGGRHTCAVVSGGVKCWGENTSGQLGNNSIVDSNVPVSVEGLSSNVEKVDTGFGFSCALTTQGGVKCWGNNESGQLGDGTNNQSLVPVDVLGLASEVVEISINSTHACALISTGTVKCWGDNSNGQLGDGSRTNRNIPTDVTGLSNISSVSVGDVYTCAVTGSGSVKCWGANYYGQLGDGGDSSTRTPVDVLGLPGSIHSLSAGGNFTCGLTNTGIASCWGNNRYGQFGNGVSGIRLTPVDVNWFVETVTTTIPSTGGTFVSTDDSTSYEFAPGVFTDTVDVSHSVLYPGSVPSIDNNINLIHAFEVNAISHLTGDPVQPSSAYTITVQYDETKLGNVSESTLALYRWSGTVWEKETTSITDISSNVITAHPTHFSVWAVLGEGDNQLYLPIIQR